VADPIVLLCTDDALADRVTTLLRTSGPAPRLLRARPDAVLSRCADTHVDVVVLDSIQMPDAATLVEQVTAGPHPPHVVVLVDDPADSRRAAFARAGAWECVLGHGAAGAGSPTTTRTRGATPHDAAALLAPLLDRLLLRGARDAALGAQARQFQALVEASSDGVYILNEGRFAWVNRRFQEMVGFSAAELTAPGFSMLEQVTAPESVAYIEDRARRVLAGEHVEPRYEFVARRKDGSIFDAHVSIAYLDVGGGRPGALGIMQDITERKRFEQVLLRKNRELQLLNGLTAAVTGAGHVDETLQVACRHVLSMLDVDAAGVALLQPDGRTLALRAHERLTPAIAAALEHISLDSGALLAESFIHGRVVVVDDLAHDPRITVSALRTSAHGAAVVVPLRGRGERRYRSGSHIVGVAFALLPPHRLPTEGDNDLMVAIGNVLGSAVERAAILEAEQHAVRELVALDEIALALASTLDADDIALTVARSTHRLFGAARVLIARLAPDGRTLQPVHILDDGEPIAAAAHIACSDTIMGLSLRERRPVQRLRPQGSETTAPDPLDGRPVSLLPYEASLLDHRMGTAVAVPILSEGAPIGALWLGYGARAPLPETDLQVLLAIGTHVAIATKNAKLFEGRERALEDLRAAQQKLVESEKLNAIGLIAHGVAHDFNNVLGSILGRAQLLKGQLRDPALVKHAEIIEKAALDGAETVRRIQEIGRQDRIDDFVAVDAAGIVGDVLELTRPRWLGRGIDVTAAAGADIAVAGNPSELREVLINLVHNAVDAMPDGGTIELSASVEQDRVKLRVRDSGSGIPADILGRIFDPYFTTKGERGTGLGLSVSQSIVRRHGGELQVTSQTSGPQRGTTFVLDLPRYTPPPAPAGAPVSDVSDVAAATTATSGVPGRARILVVDDEENIREILSEMLSMDHDVVTAADGYAAIERVRTEPGIDLVFTDLGLPGMSGYDVARELKRLRPDLLIGLVTGWGATLDADKARQHGVDMVISKPFRFEQVLGAVDEALLVRRGR
jgi:PAS domain S-box-containing protein